MDSVAAFLNTASIWLGENWFTSQNSGYFARSISASNPKNEQQGNLWTIQSVNAACDSRDRDGGQTVRSKASSSL
jgi:hypothetical protein